jgi:hypothetical protein
VGAQKNQATEAAVVVTDTVVIAMVAEVVVVTDTETVIVTEVEIAMAAEMVAETVIVATEGVATDTETVIAMVVAAAVETVTETVIVTEVETAMVAAAAVVVVVHDLVTGLAQNAMAVCSHLRAHATSAVSQSQEVVVVRTVTVRERVAQDILEMSPATPIYLF